MYLNPQLQLELEIGATLPVHEVKVNLKPNIQREPHIPNQDGSPMTPSPPASPRETRDEEIEMPIITSSPPQFVCALSYPDQNNHQQTGTTNETYQMAVEQNKDPSIAYAKMVLLHMATETDPYDTQDKQSYAKQIKHLYLTPDHVLMRKFYRHDGREYDPQVVVPQHLRQEIIKLLHNSKTESHRGVRKTMEECRKEILLAEFPSRHIQLHNQLHHVHPTQGNSGEKSSTPSSSSVCANKLPRRHSPARSSGTL